MKPLWLIGVLACLLGLGADLQPARASVSAAEASKLAVQVILPTGIWKVEALALDLIPSRGTVTLSPLGGLVAAPGGELPAGADGQGARVAIASPPSASYTVSLPSSLVLAGRAIKVTRFRTGVPLAGTLAIGHHELVVGATVAISAYLPPGRYSAAFDLTIQNN